MNKKILIFIFITFITIKLFSEPKEILPITDIILKDIDSDELLKREFDLEFYDLDYIELVWSWEEEFLSKLEIYPNKSLLGKWFLVDNKSNIQKNKNSKYYSPYNFKILYEHNYFEYNDAESYSNIYFDGKDYYFTPIVYSILLKKMVVENDKIYFYVLKNGEWILDPIHEGGKYYYVKEIE